VRTSLIGITISCSLIAFSAQAQTPTFTAASVINAASRAGGVIAPGMVASIIGSNLGDPRFFRSCAASKPVPTTCFGISVLVNGTPVPVLNNSASQLSFQVPFNIGGSTATVQVTSNLSGRTLSSTVATVPAAATAPGLFTANSTGSGTGYYSDLGTLVTEYSQPVLPGDTVVLFGTGFGATSPVVAAGALGPNPPAATVANVSLTINAQNVPVTFAGLQAGNITGAVVGYDEVIFTAPSGLTVPAGKTEASFPMMVTVGGVASQTVNLRVGVAPPEITAISPNPVPVSSSAQTVTFTGSGFQQGLTLTLESAVGPKITVAAANITVISSSEFSAPITVGTTAGTWSVVAVNPDGGESNTFNFTTSGAGPASTITSIVTTSSNAPQIAPNTWIEVHGTNLSQVSYLTWSDWDFKDNGLPTALGGVSATVNGKPAAIFFVSPTQVNILAPLDSATGTVPLQLSTPFGKTTIVSATELQTSPAFLVIDANGHVAAQHLDYTYVGPASKSAPGYKFTGAQPGETVVLYATGFGQTNPPITDQLNGRGPLPSMPSVTIGNIPAVVSFAGVAGAGLYQFNVIVPQNSEDGDLALLATFNGASTQGKVVITVGN
jgi:uncharacterized protein (TIGR03437 family)